MNPAGALNGILGLAAFLAIYLGPWQWACADYARSIIFAERDWLFDQAAAGRISFNDPKYIRARDGLNRLARFSHVVTLFRIGGFLFDPKKSKTTHVPDFFAGMGASDTTLENEVKQSLGRVFAAIIVTALLRSLGTGLVVVVADVAMEGAKFMTGRAVRLLPTKAALEVAISAEALAL